MGKVYYVKDSGELVSPTDDSILNFKKVSKAQAFRLAIKNVCVNEDYEGFGRGGNDVLVISRARFGTKPTVERYHYYEDDVPKGNMLDTLISENIYICEDYNDKDTLWFEVSILEIDRFGKKIEILSSINNLVNTLGAVFPVAIPYTAAASVLVKLMEKAADAFEKNDKVITKRFRFNPSTFPKYDAKFMPGRYVICNKEIDTAQYCVDDYVLKQRDNNNVDFSYIVLSLYNEAGNYANETVSQKIATIMSQINNDEDNDKISPTIDFLRETVSGYDNFKKICRYNELKNNDKRNEDEEKLYEKLQGELEEYF